MAYLTDLVEVRDAFVAELKAELARRAALVGAGNPPPTDYSIGGRSVTWNAYLAGMTDQIERWNDLVVKAGGEGVPDFSFRGYT